MHKSIQDLLLFFPMRSSGLEGGYTALAYNIADTLEGPEAAIALRKLLESMDAARRAAR